MAISTKIYVSGAIEQLFHTKIKIASTRSYLNKFLERFKN